MFSPEGLFILSMDKRRSGEGVAGLTPDSADNRRESVSDIAIVHDYPLGD